MKSVMRIFIILTVVAVICGVTFLLVNNGSTPALGSLGEPGERHLPGSDEFTSGDFPDGFEREGHHGLRDRLEGRAFSWLETIRTIVIVAAVVIIVSIIDRISRKQKAKRFAPVAVSPSDLTGRSNLLKHP